jgi:flagellin-specific chaperone FliS
VKSPTELKRCRAVDAEQELLQLYKFTVEQLTKYNLGSGLTEVSKTVRYMTLMSKWTEMKLILIN